MKNLIIALTVLFFGTQMNIFAQNNAQTNNNHQRPAQKEQRKFDPAKMTEMRVKQMSHMLMLSDAQAAKFEPIYKNYLQELQETYKAGRPAAQTDKATEHKAQTDADIDAQFKKMIQTRAKIVSLQEEYYDKFRKVLSAKQTLRLITKGNQKNDPRKDHKDRRHDKRNFKAPQRQGQPQHFAPRGNQPQPRPQQTNK